MVLLTQQIRQLGNVCAAARTTADARRPAVRDAVGMGMCEKCQHHAPLACAVAVIRWGPNTSSDKLRRCARCTACGNKGATIQHPAGAVMMSASCRSRWKS